MYEAAIDRKNPCAFVFLVDQSGSMSDINENNRPLAVEVADCINRFLYDIVTLCTKSEGIRDYFDIAVIGYGENGCYNAFKGVLGSGIMHSIGEVGNNPLRIEERIKKVSDGAGGILEQNVKFPVWVEAVSSGGTPMFDAFKSAANELVNWCDMHQDSFPPIILNITDGEPTGEDPEPIAEQVKNIATNDGNVLVFNAHITKSSINKILFVSDESTLPTDNAKRLYRMSSKLTDIMKRTATQQGFSTNENTRGYAYNADMVSLVTFIDIGSRAGNLR